MHFGGGKDLDKAQKAKLSEERDQTIWSNLRTSVPYKTQSEQENTQAPEYEKIFARHIFILQYKYLCIHYIYTTATCRTLNMQQENQHLKRNNQTI